jgi:hypothetical protein
MSTRKGLMDLIEDPNCFTMTQKDLVPLQLEAARELLAERRAQLPILDRRAREMRRGSDRHAQ